MHKQPYDFNFSYIISSHVTTFLALDVITHSLIHSPSIQPCILTMKDRESHEIMQGRPGGQQGWGKPDRVCWCCAGALGYKVVQCCLLLDAHTSLTSVGRVIVIIFCLVSQIFLPWFLEQSIEHQFCLTWVCGRPQGGWRGGGGGWQGPAPPPAALPQSGPHAAAPADAPALSFSLWWYRGKVHGTKMCFNCGNKDFFFLTATENFFWGLNANFQWKLEWKYWKADHQYFQLSTDPSQPRPLWSSPTSQEDGRIKT